MRKTRKRVLELLAFVMVVMTAVSCISFLAPIAAYAAVQDPTLTDLTFVVPEAIYLAPNSSSLTSATTSSFQYYVNNTVTGAPESTAGTTGRVYYKYDGASNATLTYKFLDKNPSALSGGSITHTTSLTSGTAGSITAGMSPSLAASVTGCYIQWTLKFTDAKDSNKTKNAIAYTYVYKPNVMPAAGGADAGSGASGANWAGNITWISGAHSVAYVSGNGGSEDYDDEGDYFAYITGDRGFSAFIQKDTPAYMGTDKVTSGTRAKIASSSWTSSTSGADMQYVVYGGTATTAAAHITTQGDNNSAGGWGNNSAGTNTFSIRNLEWGKYRKNGNHCTVIVTSDAVASIAIDSSRYSNLKDIPQLGVGMMVTDDQRSGGSTGNWYMADNSGLTGFRVDTHYTSDTNMEGMYNTKNYIIAGQTTGWNSMNYDETEGLRYAGAWPRAISESTPMYTIHGFYGNKDGRYYAAGHTLVDLKATYYNKAALRTSVQNALKAFPNFSVTSDAYATSAFESSQTSSQWTAFVNAYKAAYKALTQVDGNSGDVATLAKNLNNAVAALKVRTTFNPNGGTINGSTSAYTTGWQVIGKNANISVDVASTCAVKGYELKKCSRCLTPKTFELELDPDNHTGSTYEYVVKNVTCTEDGIISVRCTGCDHEFETKTVTATGHNYESVVTKEAKCEVPGELRYTCKNCGDSYTEEIPALEHNYVGVVTTPNSCFKTGIKTFTCSLCSKSYTEVIPAIGHHDYKELIDLPATCTEAGHATYTCAVCGDSYEKTIPAAGHFYEDIVVEATCQHGGYTIHTCIVCGDSYTDSETPVSDHHWDDGVELKGATCTRAATILYTCKDCGTQKAVTVGSASHKFGDWVIIKDATCYEYGIRTCECSVCGQGKTEFIPYADHHFVKDGVDSDGVHWSYCDVCDKKIVTNAEDGSQHEKDACDICGKVHKKGDLFATLFCFVMRIVKFFRNLFTKG